MFSTLLKTRPDTSALFLRLGLAVVIFPHGAQKLLGWFGGFGLSATLEYFSSLGIPLPLGLAVVLLEFFGPLALVVGLMSRLAAAGLGVIMLVGALMVHVPHGFFMNWFGDQAGEGFEFHVLAVAIAAAIVVKGSGILSVDRYLATESGSV